MTADIETIVIGAGAVGLAVARALAIAGHEVMVLEQHELIGSETSSRNSEVIHAGIYYPPGSLRATLCVRGKELLYAFCAENSVPHARCGKLLVATQDSARYWYTQLEQFLYEDDELTVLKIDVLDVAAPDGLKEDIERWLNQHFPKAT